MTQRNLPPRKKAHNTAHHRQCKFCRRWSYVNKRIFKCPVCHARNAFIQWKFI